MRDVHSGVRTESEAVNGLDRRPAVTREGLRTIAPRREGVEGLKATGDQTPVWNTPP